MKRGTRVGQAYVDLVVNGDGANKDIVDSFEETDYDKIGRDSGGRISKGFNTQIIKDLRGKLEEAINGSDSELKSSIGRMGEAFKNDDAITKGVRHQVAEAFSAGQYDSLIDRVGNQIGDNLGDSARHALTESILNSLEDIQQKAARGNTGGSKLVGARGDGGVALPTDQFDKITQAARKAVAERTKLNEKEIADYLKDWDAALKQRDRLERESQRRIELISKARAKFERDQARGRVDNRGVDILPGGNKSLAKTIGGFFGAGSRNNFLNFFGSSLENILRLTEKVSEAAKPMFKGFVEGFEAAEEGASGFQKLLSGLRGAAGAGGGLFKGITASGPGAVASVVVLIAVLSSLASIISALIGLVTALASTIVTALVGSLAVLGGAFLAVVAAGGLLTAAFTSMTDAQRKLLSQGFMPVKQAMTGIGQLIFSEFTKPLYDGQSAITIWSANIQRAIVLLQPFSAAVGRAFAQAGALFTAALSGPGFQQFAQALGVYLPGIIRYLSMALGNFLNGSLSLFAAILPYVQRFAVYLQNLTTRFREWAASAEGQNAIATFMDRAFTSVRALWGAIREVGGLISDVLFSPEAMGAGNTIFDGIASKFAEFREAIKEASANGDLQRWFNDAIEFGTALWAVIESLAGTFMAFVDSGSLEATSTFLTDFSTALDGLNFILEPVVYLVGSFVLGISKVPGAIAGVLGPIGSMIGLVSTLGNALDSVLGRSKDLGTARGNILGSRLSLPPGLGVAGKIQDILKSLTSSGASALGATSVKHGGTVPDVFVNPYKDFAESLIKEGPKISAQIKNAIIKINKQIVEAIHSAITADTANAAKDAIQSMVTNIRASAEQTINTAQSALQSAAQNLSGATTETAAEEALKKVKKAQKDLDAALKNQAALNKVADKLKAQKYFNTGRVNKLVEGLKVTNATLADYVRAREKVTKKLDDANKKLADAIALRNDYKATVTQGVQEFGNLLTAQAQTIGGIEQALTVGDITTNLEQRLAKIRDFQNNLRILLAQGLSNSAYKQLVDAGVEGGSAYAAALVQGGAGSIQQLNSLVSQIDSVAGSLGSETSKRLYQAGVDAARGLVDGLTSLSKQLDNAATKLGNSIAAAVKKSLGIHSPSTVMMAIMDDVGDGTVIGLDNQKTKVGAASERLASQVAVTPGGKPPAEYGDGSGTAGDPGVSGNQSDPRFRDLIIQTPTEDPAAVAHEVLNEVVGRM